jgi:hypothetical protein
MNWIFNGRFMGQPTSTCFEMGYVRWLLKNDDLVDLVGELFLLIQSGRQ